MKLVSPVSGSFFVVFLVLLAPATLRRFLVDAEALVLLRAVCERDLALDAPPAPARLRLRDVVPRLGAALRRRVVSWPVVDTSPAPFPSPPVVVVAASDELVALVALAELSEAAAACCSEPPCCAACCCASCCCCCCCWVHDAHVAVLG